ncbi:hypothetical protein VNO78_08104 [Psophocarpus tetragonolobus]|uniref:Uncharacterized protein n=1 Tax=Psophocarpus tetragonolobus TaxID=3891 RepID=A0AAN9XSA8_PSOTE
MLHCRKDQPFRFQVARCMHDNYASIVHHAWQWGKKVLQDEAIRYFKDFFYTKERVALLEPPQSMATLTPDNRLEFCKLVSKKREKYVRNGDLFSSATSRGSPVWNSVTTALVELKKGFVMKLGDGRSNF